MFNSVPYSKDELKKLFNDIDNSIKENCEGHSNNVLFFSPDKVSKAISKLKVDKHDGSLPLTSDNILNATNILTGHLALLFSAMLKHGFTPDGMSVGTMVPIPKSKWN